MASVMSHLAIFLCVRISFLLQVTGLEVAGFENAKTGTLEVSLDDISRCPRVGLEKYQCFVDDVVASVDRVEKDCVSSKACCLGLLAREGTFQNGREHLKQTTLSTVVA